MSEVEKLRGEVVALSNDVSVLKKQVAMLADEIPGRVATLENRVGNAESRMNRIDSLLLDMQLDIRGIQKSITSMQTDNAARLDELRSMVSRILASTSSGS